MATTRHELSKASDAELVHLTLSDPDIYRHLIERYEAKLKRFIFRISSATPEDAEDILQEVFLNCYRSLRAYDASLSFNSWIYRMTHNAVISFWRKERARGERVNIETLENTFLVSTRDDSFARALEHKMTATDVQRVLAAMKPEYREVLILKYFEDKTYEEMSDIVHKPRS